MASPRLEFHPVTPERWEDLALLFGSNGNPNYCWCQYWRMSSTDYSASRRTDRKAALGASVEAGTPVGILGYLDGEPVGWCSVAPRPTYERLQRSRTIKPVDERPVWSIVCIFLAPAIQGQGYSEAFIRAAVDYAKSQGAECVEAYPIDPVIAEDGSRAPNPSYRFMGFTSVYLRAGFKDVTSAGAPRHILRYE